MSSMRKALRITILRPPAVHYINFSHRQHLLRGSIELPAVDRIPAVATPSAWYQEGEVGLGGRPNVRPAERIRVGHCGGWP